MVFKNTFRSDGTIFNMSKRPKGKNMIKILVADDHPIVREGLIRILKTEEDFVVVGEVGSGTDVVENVKKHKPDVVLLDLQMPGMGGVDVIRHLKEQGEKTKIVIFTAFDSDERIVSTFKAGADGYLLKGTPSSEIINTVRTVFQGSATLQPEIAAKLIRQVTGDFPRLTPKELVVLGMLSKGLTNKQIASDLFITESTVKFHASSIFNKLGAESRTEAVSIAIQKGLISI